MSRQKVLVVSSWYMMKVLRCQKSDLFCTHSNTASFRLILLLAPAVRKRRVRRPRGHGVVHR